MITKQVIGYISNFKYDGTKATFSINSKDGYSGAVKWTNAEAYGKLAEYMDRNNAKGRLMFLAGQEQWWTYQPEGAEEEKLYDKLVVTQARFCDSVKSNYAQRQEQENFVNVDDDLPF